jgi:quercetin dioxygenase-like cupin family protein
MVSRAPFSASERGLRGDEAERRAMLVVSEENRPLVEWRTGVRTRLHASGSTGARRLCVMEQFCDPATGAPPHRHDGVEEVIVVLAGRARFHAGDDDETAELAAGQSIVLPAGSRHSFVNVGDSTLRILATFSAATPAVEYEGEEGVLEIGGSGAERRDAHRAYRPADAPTGASG